MIDEYTSSSTTISSLKGTNYVSTSIPDYHLIKQSTTTSGISSYLILIYAYNILDV